MPVPQRILVTRLSAMGDVAMCVPVLLALHKQYPNVKVVALSRKRFQPILEQVPNLHFVAAHVDQQHKGIAGLWRLSRQLKAMNITAIADFHDVLRTKMLRVMMLNISSATIDKGRKEKKKLVHDPTFFKALKHTTQRYAQVLEKLGYNLSIENHFLKKRPLSSDIHQYIGHNGLKWVCFAPFAAHTTKSLTPEKATQIAAAIAQLPGVQLLLLGGGKKEVQLLEQIARQVGAINLAGQYTFEQELDIISNLDVMIAMDSGNGHLAAMYGVPVISLWGNTHPFAGFAPYGQPLENQLTVDRNVYPLVPTSVFGKRIIDGYEDVTNTIETIAIITRLSNLLGIQNDRIN